MSDVKEAAKSKPESAPKASVKVEKQSPTCIYLGPNLPGGRLLQSTVFRGGIPEYLKPLLEELPDVEELIVPVDIMSEVQERIGKTGTAEYVAYQTILKGEN
ncbi:hypothetical protein [Paenibacillus sp. FSL R5-0928]|uniref:hypothetical protein n=1 Tax=unclassified Paenibacillus TaxID=185978 RepID=UPI0030D98E40